MNVNRRARISDIEVFCVVEVNANGKTLQREFVSLINMH